MNFFIVQFGYSFSSHDHIVILWLWTTNSIYFPLWSKDKIWGGNEHKGSPLTFPCSLLSFFFFFVCLLFFKWIVGTFKCTIRSAEAYSREKQVGAIYEKLEHFLSKKKTVEEILFANYNERVVKNVNLIH